MYYVYIMTNKTKSVLYTGVTNDLERRVQERKSNLNQNAFTSRYKTYTLVYYETTTDINSAITREKQIKNLVKEKERSIDKSNESYLVGFIRIEILSLASLIPE